MIKYIIVSIARSTAPVPGCIFGVQYSISCFSNFQISVYSSEMNASPHLYPIYFFPVFREELKCSLKVHDFFSLEGFTKFHGRPFAKSIDCY